MNSGFYITELGKDNKQENKSNNNNADQAKSLDEININFTLSSTKNDEITLEKSKHNILDYIIREETNFADLHKVEKYYKSVIIENSKKFDKTDKIIKDKLQEIEYVQDLINREIIANIELEKEEMIELYRIEKDNIESKIKHIEHDVECYQHMYERSYKGNYMLKKSMKDQLIYEDKYEQQLNQYEIMKNKAYAAFLTRKNLLAKMRSFENMSLIKNHVQIEEMQKLYHELEEQVRLIKSETLEMEYKLNLIEEDIKKKEKKISVCKQKNLNALSERNSIIKDILIENIKIIKIYQTLNANSLNEVIEIFNSQKFNYQSNYSQFNNLNKEIVDLKIIYTAYEHDLIEMERNVKHKELKDSANTDYKADIDVINLEIELKECNDGIEEDIEKIALNEKIFIKLKKDFNSYDKKLNYVINSINYLNSLKFIDKDSSSSGNSKDKSGKIASTNTLNNLVHLKELMPNDNEWNENNIKYFFKYLSRFSSKMFYCLNHYMIYSASEALNKNHINSYIFWENTEKSRESALIIPLNKKQLLNYYEETISLINEKANNKNKQTTKSEKDNFLDRQNVEETKKKEIKQKKSTVTGLFNNFLNDQSGFDSKIRKEDIKRSIEFKILTHVSKFTNDLVGKDFLVNAEHQSPERRNKIRLLPKLKISNNKYMKTSFNSTDKFYDTRASMRINDNDIRKNYESVNKINEDSYYSEPEDDNIKKFNNINIKKKNNMLGKEKRDMDKFVLYKGMENLNNLENKFHQDKEDKAVSSVKFNFRYHNIKRQFFDEIKEKNLIKHDNFTNKDAFLKNVSNENCNVILKEKMNDKNSSKKNYIGELFNDNFLKENEKLLFNHFQETKKNFRNSYMEIASTKHSSKGFLSDVFDMKNSISNFRISETFKKNDSKKFGESI